MSERIRGSYDDALYKSTYTSAADPGICNGEANPEFQFGGGTWRARQREPIMGVWGRAPSGVQGQSPWSEVQGGEAPLKLKASDV